MLPQASRFMRFALVGGTVTGVYYVLLVALTALGIHYVLANSIGWLICVCLNFLLNRRFTFQRKDSTGAGELAGFATTYVLQYLLGTGALVLFVEVVGLSLTPAFLLTLITTTLFSYASLARFVFRPRQVTE
ncbi:MAG: GtrA family protein [Sphingobium sp.]|nr:GtrA family protein [Sphingobium sp.]